ncbi:MAG: cell division protein FtsA [Candidatus Omnitrophica bacterium]|jgi:cell division protein FtsA|nr:cell division protein FtsA [Candidatus Omnitrophota bacterium]
MINKSYVCALDIGSSKIACALALIKRNHIENIYFDSIPSRGVKAGVIIDAVELVSMLSKVIKNLELQSGIKVKFIHTNFSGKDISTKHSHAIIPLAERGNKVITSFDIQKANEQARILGSNMEEEIIHTIPSSYAIDSKSNVINPVNLYSHRLEVDLYLVCARIASLQSLSRAVNQSGHEIRNLSFSGLATSKAVMSKEYKTGVTVVCDIGSDVTEIILFKDGLLRDIQILPVGGNMVTASLSEALKINAELAEDIKRTCGIVNDSENISENKEILIKKDQTYRPIKQKEASQVICSSVKLIVNAIKEAVEKKMPLYEINNFVVVGKTLLIDGFIESLEQTLELPVKMGHIENPEIVALAKENNQLCGQKYLTYITCLGMICEELETKSIGTLPLEKPIKNLFFKAVNRFKEVYQEYF